MNRKKAESKRKKFHLNRIAFLFPIIFYAIYAVVYLIIFPDALLMCDKEVIEV